MISIEMSIKIIFFLFKTKPKTPIKKSINDKFIFFFYLKWGGEISILNVRLKAISRKALARTTPLNPPAVNIQNLKQTCDDFTQQIPYLEHNSIYPYSKVSPNRRPRPRCD